MNMRGRSAVLAAFAALAVGLVAGAGAAGTSVPKGGNLVFAGIDPNDGLSDIFVQPASGPTAVNITHSEGPRKDLSPAFSPNGSKIAFSRADGKGGASVMVVNSNGSGLVNVTPVLRRLMERGELRDGGAISVQLVAVPANNIFRKPDLVLELRKIELLITPIVVRPTRK